MLDVIIIGCGIIGASAAYELSQYKLDVLVLEKNNDIACETTKANSAIIHAGYDPEPHLQMAKLNVTGSKMAKSLCEKLSVEYKQIGSFVLAFTDEDVQTVQALYRRGTQNGVENMQILSPEQALEMEPNLSKEIKSVLYAPTGAIVNPWEFAMALAETAVINGVQVKVGQNVINIQKNNNSYLVKTDKEEFECKYIINAAGLYADKIHNMVSTPTFKIIPSRGQYYLMDKRLGGIVNKIIFQCPSHLGKGILVSPTVHGNLIVGPNAEDIDVPDNVATTSEGLEFVRKMAVRSVPEINFRESIRNFSGVRAVSDSEDFIIAESPSAKGFINLAGIKSPGLSSAPAIAVRAAEILSQIGCKLDKKDGFIDKRSKVRFKEMSVDEKTELIKKHPQYGRIICRCETITEGEILDAIRRPITPPTLDAIKRRCGTGMGRCQGGFCGPRVQEIIAGEYKISMQDVLLDKDGTFILTGKTKS